MLIQFGFGEDRMLFCGGMEEVHTKAPDRRSRHDCVEPIQEMADFVPNEGDVL